MRKKYDYLADEPEEEKEAEMCPLCDRELGGIIVKHHLIPPSKGGKDTPTVQLHKICQEKVDKVFTLMEQKRYYHSIERILENEEVIKFVKWLKNKPPEFYDGTIKKGK